MLNLIDLIHKVGFFLGELIFSKFKKLFLINSQIAMVPVGYNSNY